MIKRNKKIFLKNLEHYEKTLKGENIISCAKEESLIIYVDGKYFILNEDKAIYRKVPEIGASRVLFALKLLQAINNRYVPIFNQNGDLIFTSNQFQDIRKKMSGISEYNTSEYEFSNNLYFDGIEYYLDRIDSNFEQLQEKRGFIITKLKEIISSIGLSVSIGFGSSADVEVIETGSTIRGTNIPSDRSGKGDFDFVVRINPENFNLVKNILENSMDDKGKISKTTGNKVRLIDVNIPGLKDLVDLDFTIVTQKDKYLSTDDSLNERLANIRNADYEKYRLVIANIMFAKAYLKKNGVYKPAKGIIDGDRSYGSLGGIGIENWILQNGGSFIDAANDFLLHAEGKDFISFEKEYSVMDFGKDHIAVTKHNFPYDNFVINNMRENGYEKMIQCLKEFVSNTKKMTL